MGLNELATVVLVVGGVLGIAERGLRLYRELRERRGKKTRRKTRASPEEGA